MKVVIILCLFAAVYGQEKYNSDGFDVEEVLNNDRLLLSYSSCLTNKGPCTPEVKRAKEKIPEVLETHCAKCTDKQKEFGKLLLKKIKSDHPKVYDELAALYDPTGKYKESFKDLIE